MRRRVRTKPKMAFTTARELGLLKVTDWFQEYGCKHFRLRPSAFLRQETTKLIVTKLARELGVPETQLYGSDGTHTTWMHPILAEEYRFYLEHYSPVLNQEWDASKASQTTDVAEPDSTHSDSGPVSHIVEYRDRLRSMTQAEVMSEARKMTREEFEIAVRLLV